MISYSTESSRISHQKRSKSQIQQNQNHAKFLLMVELLTLMFISSQDTQNQHQTSQQIAAL
jgi:hypothetical protein